MSGQSQGGTVAEARKKEVVVRRWFRRRGRHAFTFGRSTREQVLTRYVLGEVGRGRSLAEVLDDSYVRNRSTAEERARLLDSPEVVAAIGEQALSELRLAVPAER